jgi:hypothetical protein
MNTELYTKLEHCWKMGYKLPKIKEYCETDYSLDDLQELFMGMWENELEAYSYKKECDRVLLSRGNNTAMATKLTSEGELHKWLDTLVSEDQLSGLYDELRCKDYTPDQIADIANYVYLQMGLPENLLGKQNSGDKL